MDKVTREHQLLAIDFTPKQDQRSKENENDDKDILSRIENILAEAQDNSEISGYYLTYNFREDVSHEYPDDEAPDINEKDPAPHTSEYKAEIEQFLKESGNKHTRQEIIDAMTRPYLTINQKLSFSNALHELIMERKVIESGYEMTVNEIGFKSWKYEWHTS